MHFEILVEDASGKTALDILVPKIIGVDSGHTFRVHPYRGIGNIPKGIEHKPDPSRKHLLEQLPRLLRGYGRTFVHYPENNQAAVIVVCDLDRKCKKEFRRELIKILQNCNPKPTTQFCIAIEEGEAWFLGDLTAIKAAYPRAKMAILDSYRNDSICGTWEKLADAVYPRGSAALSAQGRQAVGKEKSSWSENIAPQMNIKNNLSPSFCYFRKKVQKLAGIPGG